jgi:hypothetical protein
MFEVLERLPTDVALVVIGKGWEESLQTAAARRLKDRFHWCPAVPATEVVPLLSTADIAWLPHRAVSEQYRAALPNGFFQSIAAGLPTIFSSQLPECVALSEMTGAGVPANPDDLASVCHVIMELVRKPRAKGNNEILTWAAEEKQLLPIVTRLLRGNV